MEGIAGIVVPIFVVIGLGFGASATGLLSNRTADGLSDYVFVIAIPILLFRTLATAPLPQAQPWFYWLAYFAGLAAVWLAMALAARRVFGMSGPEVTIMSFAAGQANTVFIGIPLILRVFGDAGTVPMFLLLAIHLPLLMMIATILVERGEPSAGRWRKMLANLARHPILVGIVAGALFRLSGLPLPEIASSSLKLIADTAAPAALFALGMTLKRYGMTADTGPLAAVAALKLIVHPAIVYLLAFHVLPMPPVWAGVAVIFAACPTGVNGYLLAQRYQVGVANASAAIAVTTVLSVVTMGFWIWMVSGVR
ncbi:MAG: AEC family transporter [Beijerinckiaceae bacterium]